MWWHVHELRRHQPGPRHRRAPANGLGGEGRIPPLVRGVSGRRKAGLHAEVPVRGCEAGDGGSGSSPLRAHGSRWGGARVTWIRERALTLVLMAMFGLCLIGQILTGRQEYNETQRNHGGAVVTLPGYFATGHVWEATFENWESEFLQMAVFVLLTTFLVQKGSPESR